MLIGHSLADRFGTLLAVDPQLCEIMGRDERELVGVGFESLTHPDDCKRNIAAIASLRTGDGPFALRKRYIRPDGSIVWSNVQVSRLEGSGGGRLVGTIQVIRPEALKRSPEDLWRAARRIHARVQRRRCELGDDLFSDYGWLILLQIYLAEVEGRVSNVATISDIAGIRLPLVVRWLQTLEQKLLVERGAYPDLFPQLTAKGMRKVELLLDGCSDP